MANPTDTSKNATSASRRRFLREGAVLGGAVIAGGLGVSIFTFSFLHTAVLRPLPLPGGDRIVHIEDDAAASANSFVPSDPPRSRVSFVPSASTLL